jgi:hypothetical protein
MPSGVAEVLSARMEPVDQYQTVLKVLSGFVGKQIWVVRQQLKERVAAKLSIDQPTVGIVPAELDDSYILRWGPVDLPTGWLTLPGKIVDVDAIKSSNRDRIAAMAKRNQDREWVIKNANNPEVVAVDELLKQYLDVTFRLHQVFGYGTKLFWDKAAIQAEFGIGWTTPQHFPF